MKKILLFLLIAVLAMGVVSATTCVDGDVSESDPFLVSSNVTITFDNGTIGYHPDTCLNSRYAYDYSCHSSGTTYVSSMVECAVDYGTGSYCLDGACVNITETVEDETNYTCTDSDGANDPLVWGEITGLNLTSSGYVEMTLNDTCYAPYEGGGGYGNLDEYRVLEFFCDGGYIDFEVYSCEDEYGSRWYCSGAGECIENTTTYEYGCTDSDGGDYPLVSGEVIQTYELGSFTLEDTCSGVTLYERTCLSNGSTSYNWYNCQTEYGSDYICDEGACVENVTETSTEFTFEYDSSVDLSDYDSTLSSVPAIYLYTDSNEIVLTPEYGFGYLPDVHSTVETDEVWFYTTGGVGVLANGTRVGRAKWVAVFYRDLSDNQVKLFGHVDAAANNLTLVSLQPGEMEYRVATRRAPRFLANMMSVMQIGRETTIIWNYDASNGYYNSLGRYDSTEEPNEVRFGTVNVGAMPFDVTSRDGIVVKEPATYGASDMVAMELPREYSAMLMAPGEEGSSLTELPKRMWQYFFF